MNQDKRGRGKPAKYPFSRLEIGESVIIPWSTYEYDNAGALQRSSDQQRYRNSICQFQRRTNTKFETHELPAGLKVTRVL